MVVSDQKKSVSSTAGMQTSVKTSSLMAQRAEVVVPGRMKEMERAIAERDFESFGKITMQVLFMKGYKSICERYTLHEGICERYSS